MEKAWSLALWSVLVCRMAIITDNSKGDGTGNSLWCNVESLDFPQVDKRTINSFDFQQTLLVGYKWYEPDKLDGFTNEVRSILSHNPNMPPARIESIIRGIDCRWQPCRFR